MAKDSVFAVLSTIDCKEHIEKKKDLSYLSWAWAWQILKEKFPTAFYTIYENKDGLNYHTDGKTCWVKTGVTVEGIEHIEYLPIMDYRNASIPVDKVVSTDVNKTIQRSLTKAVARHGLGLYIYAGEDLPEGAEQPVQQSAPVVVSSRREAQARAKRAEQPYVALSPENFNAMVAKYAQGIPSKTGEDYRTAWINFTHAKEEHIKMFDDAVVNYRINNNL